MKNTSTPRATPIRRALVALGLALLVVAGLTACDPNSPADCTKDCIDMVYANGDTLVVAAKGAVQAEVTLYSNAARTQVTGYGKSFQMLSYPSMAITKQYQALPLENPTKLQLSPATTYWYKAKAVGAQGKVYTELGSFKTQQRTITFTIDKIWVYDDSDFTGSGELTFDARVNNGSSYRVIVDKNWPSEKTHDGIAVTKTLTGSLNTVTLQLRGSDDDCTLSVCTVPANRWDPVGGNGDTQWSTASFTLVAPPDGRDGTFYTGTHEGGLGDLGFQVWGHWTVRYNYA